MIYGTARATAILMYCVITCGGYALSNGIEPGPGNRIMGMLTFTSQPLSAKVDFRFRPALLPGIDSNKDETISDSEWQAAEMEIRKRLRDDIQLRCDNVLLPAIISELKLLEGKVAETVIHYNLPKEASTAELSLPILRKLKGLPPALISVWRDGVMIKVPQLVWFNKPMTVDVENATTVTGFMLQED